VTYSAYQHEYNNIMYSYTTWLPLEMPQQNRSTHKWCKMLQTIEDTS
jgi:hypothetical protein